MRPRRGGRGGVGRGIRWWAAVVLAVIAVLVPGLAAAQTVPVVALLEDPESYADQLVTVEGELVGDYGFRADGWVWTQLNGDPYAFAPLREGGRRAGTNVGVGVRIPTSLVAGLDSPGRYHTRGPIVAATGLWRYHDPDRQGESYLQILELDVLEPGRGLDQGLNPGALALGILLLVVAGALWRSRRRRGRPG